jgi:hypothetical protein
VESILAWITANKTAATAIGIIAAYLAKQYLPNLFSGLTSRLTGLFSKATTETHSTEADAYAAAYRTLEPILSPEAKDSARKDVTAAIANLMLAPIETEASG